MYVPSYTCQCLCLCQTGAEDEAAAERVGASLPHTRFGGAWGSAAAAHNIGPAVQAVAAALMMCLCFGLDRERVGEAMTARVPKLDKHGAASSFILFDGGCWHASAELVVVTHDLHGAGCAERLCA